MLAAAAVEPRVSLRAACAAHLVPIALQMGASRRAAPRTYAVECGPTSCRNDSSWCCHFLLLSLVWSRASRTSCLLSPDSSSAAEPAAHPFLFLFLEPGRFGNCSELTTRKRQRVENECLLFLLMGDRQRSSHKARAYSLPSLLATSGGVGCCKLPAICLEEIEFILSSN